MLETVIESATLREAVVHRAESAGAFVVLDDEGCEMRCVVLRTTDGPALSLAEGDRVLVATSDGSTGYILGSLDAAAAPKSPASVVEIVVPEGVETVRITGKRVRIAAEEELTLECSGGSVKIDRRGKVVVLGTDITSRAKRLNKVKGASVAIN